MINIFIYFCFLSIEIDRQQSFDSHFYKESMSIQKIQINGFNKINFLNNSPLPQHKNTKCDQLSNKPIKKQAENCL
jgi:hypothetical protein